MASLSIGKASKKNSGDDLEHQNRNDKENRLRSIIDDEVSKALAGFMATFKGPKPSVQKENSVTKPHSNTHKTEKSQFSSTKSEQNIKSIKKVESYDSK